MKSKESAVRHQVEPHKQVATITSIHTQKIPYKDTKKIQCALLHQCSLHPQNITLLQNNTQILGQKERNTVCMIFFLVIMI